MRMFELCDYEGKLAIHVDTWFDPKSPERVTRYYVSENPAGDFYYKSLIGRKLSGNDMSSNYTWRDNGTIVYVDYHDWQEVEIRVPVAKPHDGKEYTWRWSEYTHFGPGWARDPFPQCPDCRKWHNPAMVPCEICGHCHRPGSKCRAVACWECGGSFRPDSVSTSICPACRQTDV